MLPARRFASQPVDGSAHRNISEEKFHVKQRFFNQKLGKRMSRKAELAAARCQAEKSPGRAAAGPVRPHGGSRQP
jgi:hypothetical protein